MASYCNYCCYSCFLSPERRCSSMYLSVIIMIMIYYMALTVIIFYNMNITIHVDLENVFLSIVSIIIYRFKYKLLYSKGFKIFYWLIFANAIFFIGLGSYSFISSWHKDKNIDYELLTTILIRIIILSFIYYTYKISCIMYSNKEYEEENEENPNKLQSERVLRNLENGK